MAPCQKGKRGKFDPGAFDQQQVKFANPALRLKRLLAYLAPSVEATITAETLAQQLLDRDWQPFSVWLQRRMATWE